VELRGAGRRRDEVVFMRRVVTLAAAVCVLLTSASIAFARGGGWQPLVFNPYDATCGATTVHVEAVVNKEYFKQFTLDDGTIRQKFTGALKIRYSTDAGEAVVVNASGPGNGFHLTNGDLQFVNTGLNSFTFSQDQAAALGVPQISVSAGSMNVTFHTDGTVTGHMGNIIEDVCAELT
jgi:hypothetical protein